jgi:hypothetical protein
MSEQLPVRRGGVVVAHALVDVVTDEMRACKWWLDQDGYVLASPRRGVKFGLHRLVLGLEPGDGLEADHVNGDRLDNRRANLRVTTRAQNGQNVGVRTGRFRGVSHDPSRGGGKHWRVRIGLNGRNHHIGWYASEDEAGAVALAWIEKNMPYAVMDRCVA